MLQNGLPFWSGFHQNWFIKQKKDEKTDVSSIDVKEESKTSEHDGHAEGHDGHDGHDEHEGHAGGHDGHDEHADGKSSANKYLISPLVSFSIFCILSFIAWIFKAKE